MNQQEYQKILEMGEHDFQMMTIKKIAKKEWTDEIYQFLKEKRRVYALKGDALTADQIAEKIGGRVEGEITL